MNNPQPNPTGPFSDPSESPNHPAPAGLADPTGPGDRDRPPLLDTRLVAAVEHEAGARCHEAASLVQSYRMCAELLALAAAAATPHDPDAEAEARRWLVEARARLRGFLLDLRRSRTMPWVGDLDARPLRWPA